LPHLIQQDVAPVRDTLSSATRSTALTVKPHRHFTCNTKLIFVLSIILLCIDVNSLIVALEYANCEAVERFRVG